MKTAEAVKYEVPCPRPAHRSFADPSGNILHGQNYVHRKEKTQKLYKKGKTEKN
jgi:hypothetical protein